MLNAIQRTKLRQTALVTPLEKETDPQKWGEMAVVEYSPQIIEPRPHFVQSWLPWLRWVPSSAQLLQKTRIWLMPTLYNELVLRAYCPIVYTVVEIIEELPVFVLWTK